MEGDYKVPKGLAEKLAQEYSSEIMLYPESGTIDYDTTIDAFAERIMLDYSDDKIQRVFGQPSDNTEWMAKWLIDYLPDLYEVLLKMNNEL